MTRLRELQEINCLDCGLVYKLKYSIVVHIDLSDVPHPDNDTTLLKGFSPVCDGLIALGDTEEDVLEAFACEVCRLIIEYSEMPYELEDSEQDLAKLIIDKIDHIVLKLPKNMHVIESSSTEIKIGYDAGRSS